MPLPEGWLRMEGVTLRQLLVLASDAPGRGFSPTETHVGVVRNGVHRPPPQVAGGPDWIDIDLFDLEAYAGPGRTGDEVRSMLRALLQERFNLVARYERQQPAEVLVLVSQGPLGSARWLLKAQPDGSLPPPFVGGCLRSVLPASRPELPRPVPGEPYWWGCAGGRSLNPDGTVFVTLRAQPIHEFADFLTRIIGLTVLDRTGLEGDYYVHTEFWWPRAGAPTTTPGARPDLATALESQVGLALRRLRVETEVVTIDYAERPR